VILSTNIAETSVTIPGVRCVVDPGLVKTRGYSPLVGLDILSVQPISQAQARQRAGRAGREAPGSCYRLYTEHTFSRLRENSEPEILRCTLTSVVLELLAMGMSDLLTFDFMTSPSEEGLVSALEQLCLLGAVEGREGKEGVRLTTLGEKMAAFPLEPGLSRAILLSSERGCSEEVVCVAALLSVDSVFLSPPSLRDKMAAAHRRFHSPHGDHLTLLAVYHAYTAASGKKAWSRENFIHQRNLRAALDVRQQLVELSGRVGVALVSNSDGRTVRRALLDGLYCQTAEHVGEGRYRTLSTRQEVFIHPSSCLFHVRPHPPCVMYSQLVHTSKCYMRNMSVIEANWLAS
jgi:ATP-dependent RNA helicase DHX33